MVAEPNQHYKNDLLHQLLDDGLSPDQTRRIENHLSSCDDCRAELEKIAGDDSWWNETVSMLTESTRATRQIADTADFRPLDQSIDWIRPLLDQSDSSEASTGKLGRIDRYPIDDVIGQGGMGVVLRGTDPELNRPVAIKILSPHLAGVGAARARFMREAQAAASIVHPSIVPIYGVIPSARLPYIVMPFIRGGNLQQRIDREGPLELRELLRIGMQIAEGLAAAHHSGVIHRDIKPSNILVEEGNGRVLISDFGLARALDDATLTGSGIISGTPQYMSPEQAKGNAIDARSDLFSLGSLLYALATGRAPFRAETPLGVLRKVTETSPTAIPQINEQIPAWFDRLVGKLMQIDVDRRVDSAETAAELLGDAHSHLCNPSINPLPKSLGRANVHRRLWIAAGGLTAILFLIGIAMIGNESKTRIKHSDQTTGTFDPSPTLVSPEPAAGPIDVDWFGIEFDSELTSIQDSIDNLSASMKGVETK